MRGKRAIELASGVLLAVLKDLFTKGMTTLLRRCSGLVDADRHSSLEEYSHINTALVGIIMI